MILFARKISRKAPKVVFRKKNLTKMQKEFKEIAFEFAKSASDFESVESVILFGSVAKGDADKRSDVDILVVFGTTKAKFRDEDKIFSMSQELGKKYDKAVQMVFANKNFDNLERNFIETVLKEGIILYGNVSPIKADKLSLEPYLIFSFELNNLDKNGRNKLDRVLSGYESKKRYKSKIYKSSSEGLIKGYGCKKLGPSSIIAPYNKADIFESLFKRFKIKYNKINIWMPMI